MTVVESNVNERSVAVEIDKFFHDARTALSIALSLPTTSSKGSTPDTLKDWLDIETRAWPDLVGRLAAHQSLVQELQALEAETAEVDNSLKSAFGALSDRSATLSRLIAEAQALIPSESQKSSSLEVQGLLSYAKKVSKHTAAPPPGSSRLAEPPIPQDAHMRSSLLFRQETLLKEVGIISDASKDGAGTGSPLAKVVDPLAALAASDLLRRAQAVPVLEKTHESAEELLDLDL